MTADLRLVGDVAVGGSESEKRGRVDDFLYRLGLPDRSQHVLQSADVDLKRIGVENLSW